MDAALAALTPTQMTSPVVTLSLDLSGKDSVFISNCYRYHSGLSVLHLYQNPPAPLFGLDQVKTVLDELQQSYEGGVDGSRYHIALRNNLRKQVTEMFKRILCWLQAIATEADVPSLIQAGIVVKGHSGGRRKVAVQTA